MNITRRLETPADEPFLRDLIVATIAIELGAEAWPEPMRNHLLEVQYRGRRHADHAKAPASKSYIIVCDSRDCGWLLMAGDASFSHIVEIMIAPAFRGQGIGSEMLRGLMDEAKRDGIPLQLTVNKNNVNARRLYTRLGFKVTGDDEVQFSMEFSAVEA